MNCLYLQALENPTDSYTKFQADLMTKHADVVAEVNQAGIDKLQGLQAQHQVSITFFCSLQGFS